MRGKQCRKIGFHHVLVDDLHVGKIPERVFQHRNQPTVDLQRYYLFVACGKLPGQGSHAGTDLQQSAFRVVGATLRNFLHHVGIDEKILPEFLAEAQGKHSHDLPDGLDVAKVHNCLHKKNLPQE